MAAAKAVSPRAAKAAANAAAAAAATTTTQTYGRPQWDAGVYLSFTAQGLRLRPAYELMQRIQHSSPRRIVDLGCGAGEMTITMAKRWPTALSLEGLDSSDNMLKEARNKLGAEKPAPTPPVTFRIQDVATWSPSEPVDVIYSNATLHWLSDHATLFPRLCSYLAPGGYLAVQMPLSWELPSHKAMRDTLHELNVGTEDLRRRFDTNAVSTPAYYMELLGSHLKSIDVWTTTYYQVLEGEDPVLRWVSGTGLRPILEELPAAELARFMPVYTDRLRKLYPPRPSDKKTVYPFTRIFIVGSK